MKLFVAIILSVAVDTVDKNAACAAIVDHLNIPKKLLLGCEIKCCTGNKCNQPAICNHCLERDAVSCSSKQREWSCDPDILGTTHCGSVIGKYRDQFGVVQDIFYRGCIDHADKKAACFALGGYLKGDEKNAGHITLTQCEIESCYGINCNIQEPTLSPNAVTVFTPTVSGPTQCLSCLESNASSCFQNLQVCATNPFSLGTTHCGTAVGKYKDSTGNVVDGFFRGCINCEDKKAACATISGFRKKLVGLTQLECKIECCTGDSCNTQTPTLVKASSKEKSPSPNRGDRLVNLNGMLAFATTLAMFMYHF